MRRTVLSLALIAALAPLPVSAEGPTLLTVVGGGTANRGAVDPFHDILLAFREIEFEEAFALTRADLLALDQVRITANGPAWPAAMEATGASLTAVLAAAGVPEDATITVGGLDGYQAEITPEQRADRVWVVAHEVDGKPIGPGGRGPLWILPDTGSVAVADGEDANWVWAAYLIQVGNE